MSVPIPDDLIVSHLRSRGLVGSITPTFIDQFRMDLARRAVLKALSDAGGASVLNDPVRLDRVAADASDNLRRLVETL